MSQRSLSAPHAAQENINAIARLESEFLERRTHSERAADAIAGFAGSVTFVVLHFVWFAVWITINTGHVPGIKPFDPYPFILLSLAVSCEGVLLSTFVLMKQNRMMLRADQRAHLDLQVNLLAEKEITKMLQMQRQVCEKLGCIEAAEEPETVELSQITAVDDLAHQLEEKLPDCG